MTLFASADLLSDFKYMRDRPSTDEESTDAEVYRLLTLAQRSVVMEIAALFPRMLMTAPTLMTTADSGVTYTISGTDEDSQTVTPIGHAEVYATDPSGRQLFGSTYSGRDGDLVFEGSKLRSPTGSPITYSSGPYIRYVAPTGTLNASNEPSIPPLLRPLIVPTALITWANRGGKRDDRPYRDVYDDIWLGKNRQAGLLATLTTQYSRSTDAALAGIKWWRFWIAGGGREGVGTAVTE